ncbi:MAG: ribosome-associated translation inhibitor RaiA [Corallococcus sp.]|nr:ribosome-associated translation inhibitor RaiA [Corallococcus sp.]
MKLEIYSKNYRVTDRLKEILDAKVGKLDKYFPDDSTVAKVVMTDLGRQCKMELSINYGGAQLRAEVVGNTMYYNIDECLPKVERQIVKYRDKLSRKKKMPEFSGDYQFVSDVDLAPVEIAKTKTFDAEAMSPVEAAENLEMIGHDFYLFCNNQTGGIEAVYRRNDGTVGHLIPVIK